MSERDRRKIFISYSQKDKSKARFIRRALNDIFGSLVTVWMDDDFIRPGENIGSAILDGLKDASYFLLLISESSNKSEWVKREISIAFEQSNKRNIAAVPFLLERVEVPFEFRGLLHIDATQSLRQGVDKLVDFFRRQMTRVASLTPPEELLPKDFGIQDPRESMRQRCQLLLRDQELGDLRYVLSEKLTLKDIRVLWFDVFHTKMDDDVVTQDKALCCLELLDRSSRDDRLAKLIEKICRNHPAIGSSLR